MLQAIGRRVFLFISALHIHEIIVYCGKVCKGACCVSCITSPAKDAHFDDGRELARLLQAVTLGQPCPISHLPVGRHVVGLVFPETHRLSTCTVSI